MAIVKAQTCKIYCMITLPLQKNNELTAIDNLETLTLLQTIYLSGNKIRSLLGLQKHDVLETVDLESNEVCPTASYIVGALRYPGLRVQTSIVVLLLYPEQQSWLKL